MSYRLNIADLFCGAGGTSAGAVEAGEILGSRVTLTAINHWDVAIATHTANHPNARHLCTSLDNINPRELFKDGELDVLWASPECTHHSVARGGKPINDQSRSTAWCVVRWAEALRPNIVLVENVPEFATWGPIGTNGRPLAKRKGELFRAWKAALEACGYRVDHRILVAADYGDPTTRKRLFVQAVRGKRQIIWPDATHASGGSVDMFGTRKPWVSAREIIDWSMPGQSIYERKRPLSPKTMRRIMAGLEKFGLKPFIAPLTADNAPESTDRPLSTVVTAPRHALAQPFILTMEHGGAIRSADRPLPTVTTAKGGAMAAVQPFLVPQHGSNGPRSVDKPAPTVTTTSRGVGLAEPFLVVMKGTSTAQDIGRPAPAATTKQYLGIADPFLVQVAHGNGSDVNGDKRRSRSIHDPLNTVCGQRGDMALCEPFVISAGGPECGAREVSKPLGTVLTRDHRAIVEAALLPQQSGGALRSISEPAPTIATDGAVALVEPFIVEYYGNAKAESVDTPLNTVTCKHRHALVRPIVVINGERYQLDIRFRMLQPKELAAAQGFRSDYKFTGTKTEQVKQIGNAVPRHLARAIVLAALSQQSDIRPLLLKEEAA